MISLAQPPAWFSLYSILVQALATLVLAGIAMKTLEFYSITKQQKWLLFGSGFACLATAHLAQLLLIIALPAKGFVSAGILTIPIMLSPSSIAFFAAAIFAEFLLLYGVLLVFVAYNTVTKITHSFMAFTLFLLVYFSSQAYAVLHLVHLVLLLMVTSSIIAKYFETKNPKTQALAFAFIILVVSSATYLLVALGSTFVVFAQLLEFIGFLTLLIVTIQLSYGKKIKT